MTMRSVKVSDYMTRKLVTFTPEMPFYEAMGIMLDARVSGGPVVDEQGNLIGVLSEIDFLEALTKGSYYGEVEGTVGETMTRGAQFVTADTDIFAVSEMFVAQRRRRLPVLHEGRLVGQISRRDVLKAVRELTKKRV